MNPDQFGTRAGEVKNSRNGAYYTFTPESLPVQVSVDNEMLKLLEEVTLKLGNLNGIGKQLSNPYLLIDPFLKKEAVMSSKIEGTQSSLSDVLLFEAKEEPVENAHGDLQEVINFVLATEDGIKRIRSEEISLTLILDLHRQLLQGVRGKEKNPGAIRKVQNWIGREGSTLVDARYVPPEPEKVEPLLDNLFSFINKNQELPELIKIGLAHYQFEAIHPFRDGNGRIGRLLILLYLLKRKILDLPLLYISEYFEHNRENYYDLLLRVSQKGDYEAWLKFFLKGIAIKSDDATVKITRLLKYMQDETKEIEDNCGVSGMKIFRRLFTNPYITISRAAKATDIGYPTAERAMMKMVDLKILKLVTKQKRNRVFVCEEIVNIITAGFPETEPG